MAPGTTRLVPDVSASADPTFGAFTVFQGISQVVGGTSWATPTWAGFCALINQAVGGSTGIGALNPKIYPLLLTPAFRDVTSGSNGTYSAGIGYDEVTGIGVPDVANLISVLTSGGSAPSIISQLGNQAIVLGQDAAFSVAADGQNPLTYQWQRMPGGASAWINLSDGGVYSGSSTDNLVVSGVTYAMNGDHFQCLVSNSLGSAVSSPADLLQVNPVGVTTLAGLPGDAGYANGTFHAALFNSPGAVRTDASGNIYVADNENDVIRKITPGGTVTTIAGTPGQSGSSDGAATGGALFNDPSGVAVDASGNVYVADGGNYTVRKISGGMVTTLAGLAGSPGSADGTGSAARFQDPQNIAINRSTGNLYVPDGTGDTIRMVTPGGAVTTIAGLAGAAGTSDGTGSGARFNNPTGIAVDNSGNLFVTDYGNNSIREVSPGGVVATIAGSTSGVSGGTDGAGTSARFNSPAGIAVDSAENLYVADSANDTIREISPSGQVSTIAGSARIGDSTDGLGANARFNTPDDIAIDGAGTLYIADNVNNTIRRFVPGTLAAPQIQTQPSSATVSVGQNAAFSVSASGSPPLSYQWQRMPAGGATFVDLGDGGAYSGSAAATLTVSGVTAGMGGDQFQCVVTNNAASVTSSVATLSVPSSPVITSAPQTQSALTGTSLTLSVAATGGDLSYQWQFNGANISGATAPTYSLTDIQASSAGTYSVTVSNSLGSTSGTVLTLTVQPSSTRLVNLSARANVGTGSDVLIVGFYIGGSGSRDVLLRGDGPALALAPFNLSGVLGQPVMTLNDSGGNVITGDTGWGNSPTQPTGVWAGVAFPVQATSGLFTELGAFQLPADSADSAFEIGLGSGGYTSIISGANATSGIALAEIYDTDYISDANPGTRLVNISARAPVGTGNNILIAGFYVSGTGTETILMRGIGPTLGLAPFNVSGVLAQPVITLYDSKGNVITSNTGWGNGPSAPAGVWAGLATVSQASASVFTQVGAFQLAAGSSDSAMVVTLPAGQGYTLEVGGANGTTGVALAELYEVP